MTTSQPPTPDAIRSARLRAELTQEELAAALIDATPEEFRRMREYTNALKALRHWESGAHPPSRLNTRKLSALLPLTDDTP